MSALKVFTFPVSAQQVRVLGSPDKPWFCLTDVCSVLALSNPSHLAQKQLKQDGLTKSDTIDAMGRTQSLLFVNEANLYRCVMRSNKPEAESFQDWLVEEVLPAIRKTGSFGSVPNLESESSEFWQIIDGALKRNLEPKEAISLHKQWNESAIQCEARNPKLKLVPTKNNLQNPKPIEDRLRGIKTKDGWISARDAQQRTRLITSSNQAREIMQTLAGENKGVYNPQTKRFKFY